MKTRSTFARMMLGLALLNVAPALAQDGFVPLFNGKDLAGWVLVNTPPSTWSVEEGLLVCNGKPIGEMRTQRMYQNFVLELEWRHMVPRGNAGVFIWADDITARGQPFHRGIEVQVLENAYGNNRSHTTHGDIFPIHGATMTPVNGHGGQRAFPIENRSKPSPEWNHYVIRCSDGAISLAVNGKVVTRGTDCSPRKGYICIESEGGVVHYRNIRIKELPDTPIDEDDVAVANRNYRILYNGIDLSGWNAAGDEVGSWKPNDWVLRYAPENKTSAGTLSSIETFNDHGFIVDFRLREETSHLLIGVGPHPDGSVDIDFDDPRFADALEAPTRWNRLEGQIQNDRLQLSLNGRDVDLTQESSAVPANAAMHLRASGPVDFANVYIRPLD